MRGENARTRPRCVLCGGWHAEGAPCVRSGRKRNAPIRRTLHDFPTPTPQETPCRLWQGVVEKGYGRRPDLQRIHRWVWEQVHGPIPAGLVVRHKCDQPLCYRYAHLELGTQADNVQDSIDRGRAWHVRGFKAVGEVVQSYVTEAQ